ncbi:hypothetical protein [Actinomadura sp. 6N118]|uniref:hypothetical protein n=1 Tax=Actinomadura sp. 6N118 TaxID=3375151 RepID=UPI0037950557
MTVVIGRRHLLAGAALTGSGVLVSYAACTSLNSPGPPDPRPSPAQFVDVRSLLPVTEADLAAGADLARRFIAAYGSYRYDQTPDDYLSALHPMATDELYARLGRSAEDPTVRTARIRDHIAVTAHAQVNGIRDLQAHSIIFIVTGHQRIQRAGQQSQDTETFAVTLSRPPGRQAGWKVANLATADTGQEGDDQP